jgi:hypothetical protein
VTPGEVHAFVVWSNARDRERMILEDVARRFVLLEVVRVEWSRERFAQNLTRLYGEALPDESEKERHCGSGPLLVVVVRDERPDYGRRRTTRRRFDVVNRRTFDARSRYREWTGGGYRVHATLTRAEAARDLFLLLGRRVEAYDDEAVWGGCFDELRADCVGAAGWVVEDDLLTAVALTCGCVRLPAVGDGLSLLTGDRWWAALIANGETDPWAARHEIVVGGRRRQLVLSEPGDGALDERWQRLLLERAGDGVLLPEAPEELHLRLAQLVAGRAAPSESERERLDELAAAAGEAPVGDADIAQLEARVRAHVAAIAPRKRRLRR